MQPTEFVAKFGQYVDAKSAIVFVGAGLSQSVGYPDWLTLLESPSVDLKIGKIDDLPQLAQFFVDNVANGRERLEKHVIDTFAAVGSPSPAPAHIQLAQLPIDEFWTTNYDGLLEAAVGDARVFANDDELAGLLKPGLRRAYKMHGSIDPPGPIVLTRDDYERYPTTHPRFWQLLQAQFLTETFLFLGFGFTDPNLELVFKLVRLHTPDIKREHFAIMKGPDDAKTPALTEERRRLFQMRVSELQRVGVDVVVVDRYDDINEILGKLVARCRPQQVMVSGSAPGSIARTAVSGTYPTAPIPDEHRTVAVAIGSRLAETGIAAVAGGELGAIVGYEMMRRLDALGGYDPNRFTLVRRQQDSGLSPPNIRFGKIIFTGDDPVDLRSAALREVRALLVLAGGDGTQTEIDRALEIGLGVIPVGCTGGTAENLWKRMGSDLGGHRLGGRSIDLGDFEQLMKGSVDEVAQAAVRLVAQALFLA
jgi:hypothetical protein